MDLIFCKLKKVNKHEFNFLQTCQSSKKMNLIFLQAQKSSKNMNLIFCKLKKAQKHGYNFLQT